RGECHRAGFRGDEDGREKAVGFIVNACRDVDGAGIDVSSAGAGPKGPQPAVGEGSGQARNGADKRAGSRIEGVDGAGREISNQHVAREVVKDGGRYGYAPGRVEDSGGNGGCVGGEGAVGVKDTKVAESSAFGCAACPGLGIFNIQESADVLDVIGRKG